MSGNLSDLHRFITDHYDRDEFRALCIDLGLRYDDLPEAGLSAQAWALILSLGRRGQLEQLFDALKHTRTGIFEFDTTPAALAALYAQLPTGEGPTLAAAQAQLAALPLDHIPPLAPLPPGSRMPLGPNPLFVGREADLKALARALKGGQTTAIGQIAAATGLGGIGKTQLAAEFAHRYGPYFAGGVFWLSFGDPGAIQTEVAACGGLGGLDLRRPGFGNLPLPDQVRLVLSA